MLFRSLFRTRPEVGVRIWLHYNQRLLDFTKAHRDRCVIMPMPWLMNTPHSQLTHAITKLDIEGLRFDAMRSREILDGRKQDASEGNAEYERSFRLEHREAVILWQKLQAAASGI